MFVSADKYALTAEYIKKSWIKACVTPDASSCPKLYIAPFVPPCVDGDFRVLFYWDTYFTNVGLIGDGFLSFAINNANNLIYAVNKNGFVPNALSFSGTKWCSQPPFLHFIVRDIYEKTHDKIWLETAYYALKKEYRFWQTERITDTGLNRYFHMPLAENDLIDYYDYVAKERLSIPSDIPVEDKARLAENYIAAAESGMDFSPRFRDFGANIAPVCLNANLFGLEKDLARLAELFEPSEKEKFLKAANERKRLMDIYCLCDDGLYYDYNIRTREKQKFYSCGQFMPFVTGISDNKKALKKLTGVLEGPYGICSTQKDKKKGIIYQWAYPNTWAPDNYLCVRALEKNGLHADASRVAWKFISNVADTFMESGRLWEKYDAINGGIAKKNEYSMTEMLGWTGGVYSCFYRKFK